MNSEAGPEGAGGPLTGYDPEESPLSEVQMTGEPEAGDGLDHATETNDAGCGR